MRMRRKTLNYGVQLCDKAKKLLMREMEMFAGIAGKGTEEL